MSLNVTRVKLWDGITQAAVTGANALKVDPSGVTSPVSLASVPSHNVTNAGTFATQATMADGANTTLGAKADAKSTATDTTAVSVMSVLKQISASVQAPPSQVVTNAGTFATQSAQSGTWTVQPGNTANTTPWLVSDQHSNTTADYDSGAGTQNITMFGVALPASGGAVAGGTSSNPIRTDPTGTTTQPVSGTVTANIGTGNLAGITGVVHIDDNAGSVTVDGSVTAVTDKSGTATLTSVPSSATSVTLLAANSGRKGATIYNDSTQNLYVKFGTTASNTSFTLIMVPASYYEVPFQYTGRIDGIWAAANGNARVTEFT